jgi:hypothetical protein
MSGSLRPLPQYAFIPWCSTLPLHIFTMQRLVCVEWDIQASSVLYLCACTYRYVMSIVRTWLFFEKGILIYNKMSHMLPLYVYKHTVMCVHVHTRVYPKVSGLSR